MTSTNSPATQSFVWAWRRRIARAHPGSVAALIVLGIVNALADGLSIGLLIPLLSMLFTQGDPLPAMGGLGRVARPVLAWLPQQHLLAGSLGLIFALVMVRAAAGWVAGRISISLSNEIAIRLRSELFTRLAGAPFRYVAMRSKGELHALLDTDSWQVAIAIESFLELVTRIVIAVGIILTMFAISARLTLFVAALSLLYVGIFSLTNRFNARLAEERRLAVEELSTVEQETMDNMRTIRAFGREAWAHAAFDAIGRRVAGLEKRKAIVNGATNALREPTYVVVFALTLLLGRSGTSDAALLAMLALLNRVQPHLVAINDYHQSRPALAPAVARITALFTMTDAAPVETGRRDVPMRGAIRFEDVVFSYRPDEPGFPAAVSELTMQIPRGKVTALVGPSGSGKTTIANLLLRLFVPASGKISADGVDVATLDVAAWRQSMAIAGQDAELTSGSLRDNIAFGTPDATQEEIARAASLAGIDDFIAGLPDGYDTAVSHRGLTLSGGQRQRIGLARALVRRDAMLILDEATNALDSLTEERVMRSLAELKGSATILIITHRLTTARIADHVVVLDRGRAVEEGTPAQVYAANGLFRRMVDAQSFAQEASQEGWLE